MEVHTCIYFHALSQCLMVDAFNLCTLKIIIHMYDPAVEKGMSTHSSILAERIPWTEEPRWLQSMGSQRVGHH